MGTNLHQPGIRHLPQLLPGAEIIGRQIRHEHNDGDAGFHTVLPQDGIDQIVVAAVAVVKGDEDGLFRQRCSRRQLPRQHRRIALGQNDVQIGAEFAGRDGHGVAVLSRPAPCGGTSALASAPAPAAVIGKRIRSGLRTPSALPAARRRGKISASCFPYTSFSLDAAIAAVQSVNESAGYVLLFLPDFSEKIPLRGQTSPSSRPPSGTAGRSGYPERPRRRAWVHIRHDKLWRCCSPSAAPWSGSSPARKCARW